MKTMYFDNGCRVCRTGALLAGKSGIANKAELAELQEMNEQVSCDLDKARYCNEIAVYDVLSKESRYGIKGMVWFVEDKWGKWVNVFLFPPIYQILNFFYHIFSYNRKMIAPVYEKVENDCKPEFHWGYRLGYIIIASLVSAILIKEFSFWIIFVPNLIIALLGLILSPTGKKMEYLGHLSTISLVQTLGIGTYIFVFSRILNETDFAGVFILLLLLPFYIFVSHRMFSRRMQYLELEKYSYYYIPMLIIIIVLEFIIK